MNKASREYLQEQALLRMVRDGEAYKHLTKAGIYIYKLRVDDKPQSPVKP